MMNLRKDGDNVADTSTRPSTATATTISVNVGVPGNIKKLVLEGTNWTVKMLERVVRGEAKLVHEQREGGQREIVGQDEPDREARPRARRLAFLHEAARTSVTRQHGHLPLRRLGRRRFVIRAYGRGCNSRQPNSRRTSSSFRSCEIS